MPLKRILAIVLTSFVTVLAQPASAPDEKWDTEQYYSATINGERMGYATMRARTLPDQSIEHFTGMRISLGAGGKAVSVVAVDRYTETADGKPVSFYQYRLLGLAPIERRGTIRDGRLTIVSTQAGREVKREQKWDARVLFEAATDRLLREKLKADGDEVKLWSYSADMAGDGFFETTYKRVGLERVVLVGKAVDAVRVTQTSPSLPAPSVNWVDADMKLLASDADFGGGLRLRLEMCSKEFAQRKFRAPEVFNNTLIRLDLGASPQQIASLRLTLEYDKALAEPLKLPGSDRQRVVESTRTRLVLDLSRPPYPATAPDAPLPDDVKPYLQATEMYDAKDPAIRAAAGQAVGDRTDAVEKAVAIRDWVSKTITFKQLGIGQATASAALRARAGDCTEHAAVLVAVARAAGIPARSVTGLVYVPDFGAHKNVLGGHEWAQLYVHGQWVDFDAAISGSPAHAVRVAFNVTDPQGQSALSAATSGILALYGNVKQARAESVKKAK